MILIHLQKLKRNYIKYLIDYLINDLSWNHLHKNEIKQCCHGCCMVIMICNDFMPDHKGNIRLDVTCVMVLSLCSPSCSLSCRASFCVVRYRFTSCSAVTLLTSSGMCDSFMKLQQWNLLHRLITLVHHYLILCECKHTWMFQWNSLRTNMSPSKLSNKNLKFHSLFWSTGQTNRGVKIIKRNITFQINLQNSTTSKQLTFYIWPCIFTSILHCSSCSMNTLTENLCDSLLFSSILHSESRPIFEGQHENRGEEVKEKGRRDWEPIKEKTNNTFLPVWAVSHHKMQNLTELGHIE